MGYPMTYPRALNRNHLLGSHSDPTVSVSHSVDTALAWIRSDLRRLETDQQDEEHLARYATEAGITVEQARIVLAAFFAGTF